MPFQDHTWEFLSYRLRVAFVAAVAVVVVGTLAYKLLGGDEWSYIDALYMTVITISTVGFTEVHPLGGAGRIVTIFVILGGVGTLLYLMGSAADAVVDGRLLWRGRVARKVRRMNDHFIICGFGRVGQAIARELRGLGAEHVVIALEDPGPEARESVVVGDATNDATLERAGIDRARGLVAVLGQDADNIYTVLAARALKPDLFIVARCGEERSAKKLEIAGADRVINPYERGGTMMAQVLMRPRVVDFLDEVGRGIGMQVAFEEVQVAPGSSLVGQELKQSPLRRDLNVIVTAIRAADGTSIFNPSPSQKIGAGDILIVMSNPEGLDRLGELAGSPRRRMRPRETR